MVNLHDIINSAQHYAPYVLALVGGMVGNHYLSKEKARIAEENNRLDEDMARIPPEFHGNVGQLLRDLGKGRSSHRGAGYRIDHLLKKYDL